MKRNEFLKTLGVGSVAMAGSGAMVSAFGASSSENNNPAMKPSVAEQNASKIKLGVSLYSYQHAIETHDMNLEECLAELNSIGAQSVQIIDGITVANFPNPTQEWVDRWHEMLDKYKLTPSLMDTFLDLYNGWRAPAMTLDEQIEQMVRDMKLARRLGYKIIRPTSGSVSEPLGEWIDKVVPYAEELDVRVCPELHSPIPLKGEFVDRIMNVILKTGTKHIGFTLDMGDFDIQTRTQTQGAQNAQRPAGQNAQSTQRPGGQASREPNNPQDIVPLLPYIYNMHGKFYDMSDPKTEETYAKVFKVLVDNGYSGSIDSEYEGQRNLQNDWCTPIQEVYQVRRHHIMMRKLLGRS